MHFDQEFKPGLKGLSSPCAKTFFWNIWERNGCLCTHAWRVIGNHCAPFCKNKNHKTPSWNGTKHAHFLSERHKLSVFTYTYDMVAGKTFGTVPLTIGTSPSSSLCWLKWRQSVFTPVLLYSNPGSLRHSCEQCLVLARASCAVHSAGSDPWWAGSAADRRWENQPEQPCANARGNQGRRKGTKLLPIFPRCVPVPKWFCPALNL